MTKRALVASGFVSLFAIAGCSSDASSPGASNGGTSGTAGSGVAGSAAGSSGSGASAGSVTSAGSGGTEMSGAGAPSGGSSSGAGGTGGATSSAGAGGKGGSGGSSGSAGSAGTSGSTGCAAYKLCDDFETAAPGDAASAWTVIKNGGYAIETVTTKAHSGTHSVHAMATAAVGYAYISETKTFPATDFWGRAYLWLEAPSSGHEVFVASDSNAMEAQGDQLRYLNNTGGGNIVTSRRVGDSGKGSGTKIPMGAWFCYEWHQTPTDVHIFLNSKELTDVTTMWPEPTLVAMVLGFERFTTGTPGDIWIDDVAINSTQVGCN